MLHEGRDRQKFLSDAQYLRDMQHKVESEYQACLRRQEYRRDPNEKKRDQFGGQETNLERSRFSSGAPSKQSSSEEDPLVEPRVSIRNSALKCNSRLPAIDQTSVKQKHKSTMTTRTPEKAGPSKPTPAAQPLQILSRKRRPNLGRLTVSPDMQGPGESGDRSRQKSQLPAKAPALRGTDPVPRDSPTWASDTKLRRPTRERSSLASPSQPGTGAENTPGRARKGGPRVSQSEQHPAPPQASPGIDSPPGLSASLWPPLFTATTGGPRRAPFRFRDEDFYSILSLSHESENDDTEEEIRVEEELLLVGMHPPRSPFSHRSRFLRTSAAQAKNKNFEENPENRRANSVRSESSHGSRRVSDAEEPVTGQPSAGHRMSQDPGLPNRWSAKENDSGDSGNEKKTFRSQDSKFKPNLDDGLNAENLVNGCTSVKGRPGTHDYEREWQTYLNNSSTSLDHFLSGRPTAPRSSINSSYSAPGSVIHSAPRGGIRVDLSVATTLVHSSDSEENSRFNARQPLSPIRNRTPFASAENHTFFPVNSAHEFDDRGTEATTVTSQSHRAPLPTEDLLLNPQSSLSPVESSSPSPSRMSLQGHWPEPESLPENIPFTFCAVSDFPNRNGDGNRMAVPGFTDEEEATKIKAASEKLNKLRESLLEEDSEEEEDLCRICQIAGGSPTNPLLEPCGCVGSLQFVHQECLKKWLKVKITSGADLGTVKTCEMCKQVLQVNPDDFNMTEFYQKHQHSRVQNDLMNSGLYLLLLLHLYEQRFAELMRVNYSRVTRERLSRSLPQPRTEENENSGLGDGNEDGICQSNSRVI